MSPGRHKLFTANLYPEVHPQQNRGRYRFFYEVMLNAGTASRRDILMMSEFRLTDNKQEVERAIKMKISKEPEGYGIRYIPVQEESIKENTVYEVVEEMPEFPGGGLPKLMEFIQQNVRYPQSALQSRLEGRVIVQVVIDKDGSVIQPKNSA